MVELTYRIVKYRDCFEEAVRFRNENRPTNRGHEYFRWRYLNRPCEQEALVVWAIHKTEVVGATVVAGHDFIIDGSRRIAGIVGDISVCQERQGLGIGRGLLSTVRDVACSRFDFGLVMPNERAAGPLARAKWQEVAPLTRRAFLTFGHPQPMIRSWVAVGSRLLFLLGKRWYSDGTIDVDMEHDWSRTHSMCEAANCRPVIQSYRSVEYLCWRSAQHPDIDYRLYMFRRAGVLVGYAVAHVDNDNLWIDDLVSSVGLPAMLCALVDYVSNSSDCRGLQWRGTESPAPLSTLTTIGWLKRSDVQRVMICNSPSSPFNTNAAWFLTAGDKDV